MMIRLVRRLCLASTLAVLATGAMANEVSIKNMSAQTMPVMYELACHRDGHAVEYSHPMETIIPAHGAVHVPVFDGHGCDQAGVVIRAVAVGTVDGVIMPPPPEDDGTQPIDDDTMPPPPPPGDDGTMPPPPPGDDCPLPADDGTVPPPPPGDVTEPVHPEEVYHVNAHWEFLPADSTDFAYMPGCWATVGFEHPHAGIDLMEIVEASGHGYIQCHVAAY